MRRQGTAQTLSAREPRASAFHLLADYRKFASWHKSSVREKERKEMNFQPEIKSHQRGVLAAGVVSLFLLISFVLCAEKRKKFRTDRFPAFDVASGVYRVAKAGGREWCARWLLNLGSLRGKEKKRQRGRQPARHASARNVLLNATKNNSNTMP